MSDSRLFYDEVIERVSEFAPVVPGDVLSSTGPSAQRVLYRVLVTAARTDTAEIGCAPIATTNARTRRPSWLTRWRAGALTGVVAIVAVLVAVLVIAGGAGPSIVGRAYAATDPGGSSFITSRPLAAQTAALPRSLSTGSTVPTAA